MTPHGVNASAGMDSSFAAARLVANSIPRHVWIRLGAAYLVWGAIAWSLGQDADLGDWWLHGIWCFAGLAVAAPTLSRVFRQGVLIVLVEHRLMFLASFCLYFLFGAVLLAVGPDIQGDQATSFYPIDAREALRVDAINALGFGIALLAAGFSSGSWLATHASRVAGAVAGMPTSSVIAFFLVLGTAASSYSLWFDLGFREGVVPGLVRSAGKLSLVAIFLAGSHKGTGEFSLRAFGAALAVVLAASGALQFNKSELLLPLAALVAGLAYRYSTLRILPVGLALLVATYLAAGNPTDFGRSTLGYQEAAGPAERWQILVDGWSSTRDLREEEEYGTWARLCYTSPQAAVLDLWDEGNGGDGLRLIPWVFVPRLVAPEKPEITETGRKLNEKITRSETSSTGVGIFASGYYHAGWWGLILASALCGWILAQTSAIAGAIFSRSALLLVPLALLGMYIAFRIDGDFISDYLGTFVFILYPLLGASAFLIATRHSRRIRRPSSQ